MKIEFVKLFVIINLIESSTSLINVTESECKSSKSFKAAENLFKKFDYENLTEECEKSMKIYENGLRNFEIWALEMLDSSSKPPTSILNGNLQNFGDFDSCMNLKHPDEIFRGKFCLSSIMFEFTDKNLKNFELLKHRILAGNTYISEFDDVSHMSPKSSEIKWALCVPSSCVNEDVKIILEKDVGNYLMNLPIKVEIQMKEEMCQVKSDGIKFDKGTKIAMAFFGLICFSVISSTLAEIVLNFDSKITKALSLVGNFKDLISTESTFSDMPSVHGIRSIFSILLLFTHKAYDLFFEPITNKFELSESFKNSHTIILRISHLHTDIFLMLSGFLVSYSIIKKILRGEKIKILSEILNRYFRLMPNVAFMVIFMIFISPQISSGPLWPILIDYQSKLCAQTWWRNFLMIQNLMGFEEICMMHTHHIATDFQLSIFGPIIAGLIVAFPLSMIILVISSIFGISILRFVRSQAEDISVFVSLQGRVKKMHNHDTIFHVLPHYRIAPYFIGILLAYAVVKMRNKKLSDFQLNLGWLMAVTGLVVTVVISVECANDVKLALTLFSSLCTICMCGFVGWILFTSEMGCKNFLSPFIEWKYWRIFANLSYAIYLVQFAVYHYNIGIIRSSSHFTYFGSFINLNELFMILFSALFLTLFIDYPCRNLKKLLSRKKTKSGMSQKQE